MGKYDRVCTSKYPLPCSVGAKSPASTTESALDRTSSAWITVTSLDYSRRFSMPLTIFASPGVVFQVQLDPQG